MWIWNAPPSCRSARACEVKPLARELKRALEWLWRIEHRMWHLASRYAKFSALARAVHGLQRYLWRNGDLIPNYARRHRGARRSLRRSWSPWSIRCSPSASARSSRCSAIPRCNSRTSRPPTTCSRPDRPPVLSCAADLEEIARSSDAERAQWRPRWLQITDDLLARSRQEARAGAKIITWAEESAFLLSDDVPTVLEQARSVARDESVYLQLALQPILHTQQFPFAENRAIMIDRSATWCGIITRRSPFRSVTRLVVVSRTGTAGRGRPLPVCPMSRLVGLIGEAVPSS